MHSLSKHTHTNTTLNNEKQKYIKKKFFFQVAIQYTMTSGSKKLKTNFNNSVENDMQRTIKTFCQAGH